MEQGMVQRLLDRNQAILETLLNKIQREFWEDVDLIVLGGSFLSGDFYEKSDLDLQIIMGEGKNCGFARCFLLEDVGFDLYGQSWEDWEKKARLEIPYANALQAGQILYSRNQSCTQRFETLRKKLRLVLEGPFTRQLAEYAGRELSAAYEALGRLCLETRLGQARMDACQIFFSCSDALCRINRHPWQYGTRRRLVEIASMEAVPADFLPVAREMVESHSIEGLLAASRRMLSGVKELLSACIARLEGEQDRPEASAAELQGTFEECWSNYGNKIGAAVREQDAAFAYLTGCCCQDYFDEMQERFGTPAISLMEDFSADRLETFQAAFDRALEQYLGEYRRRGMQVERYETVEEFRSQIWNQRMPQDCEEGHHL